MPTSKVATGSDQNAMAIAPPIAYSVITPSLRSWWTARSASRKLKFPEAYQVFGVRRLAAALVLRITATTCAEVSSNGNNESVKRLRPDRKLILFQSSNVLPNRVTRVLDRFLSAAALGNAPGKAWTLSHPLPILSSADDDLAHGRLRRALLR